MRIRNTRMIGELIRDGRARLGWSQSRLAEEAGVSRQWVYEMEQGKPSAEVGLVLITLEALGLQLHVTGFGASAASGEGAPGVSPIS